jgi:hypothetical protein
MTDYTCVYNVKIRSGIYKGNLGIYYKNGTPEKKYSHVCLIHPVNGIYEITISESLLKFLDEEKKLKENKKKLNDDDNNKKLN